MSNLQVQKLLLGELPDLRDTQSGKDLIRIGKEEGKQEMLIGQLESRFGTLPAEIRQRIQQLSSIEKLDDLSLQVLNVKSLDELQLFIRSLQIESMD